LQVKCFYVFSSLVAMTLIDNCILQNYCPLFITTLFPFILSPSTFSPLIFHPSERLIHSVGRAVSQSQCHFHTSLLTAVQAPACRQAGVQDDDYVIPRVIYSSFTIFCTILPDSLSFRISFTCPSGICSLFTTMNFPSKTSATFS